MEYKKRDYWPTNEVGTGNLNISGIIAGILMSNDSRNTATEVLRSVDESTAYFLKGEMKGIFHSLYGKRGARAYGITFQSYIRSQIERSGEHNPPLFVTEEESDRFKKVLSNLDKTVEDALQGIKHFESLVELPREIAKLTRD